MGVTETSISRNNQLKFYYMSARSTQIKFTNITNCVLVLTGSNLNHGEWNGGPTIIIKPEVYDLLIGQNDSDGFMTGDQGSLTYAIIGITDGSPTYEGSLNIGWDNPYAGSNGYSQNVSSNNYTITNSGGSGDNASVTFTLSMNV